MRRYAVTILFLAFFLPGLVFARTPERAYQEEWCADVGGVVEYTLPDKTRVDCLTGEYAVEVDFASKWAEAVGQSLYYAEMTGRRPGVLLILEDEGDLRHLERLVVLAKRFGIQVWTTGPGRVD
ncbi:MAG: hypothetical protein HY956_00275 [Deltaproteobacteria bacterium]|nr:hypothetical protein [Deltaproteobacteria bacterium]